MCFVPPVTIRPDGWISYEQSERLLPNGDIAYNLGGNGLLRPELVLGDLRTLDTRSNEDVAAFLEHGIIGVTAYDLGLGVNYEPPTPAPTPWRVIHVGDVALILRCIQACSNHWVRHARSEPLHPAWDFMRDEDRLAEPFLLDEFVARGEGEGICWHYFTRIVNAGLKQRPPHVSFRPVGSWVHDDPALGLFSALCIQLMNVMVDDLPIRDCANETCKNVFQRQHGRARKGQYRTEGVMFCSASCARAQAQRELRRRKKAANRQEVSK